jgi:hypothetical protein
MHLLCHPTVLPVSGRCQNLVPHCPNYLKIFDGFPHTTSCYQLCYAPVVAALTSQGQFHGSVCTAEYIALSH